MTISISKKEKFDCFLIEKNCLEGRREVYNLWYEVYYKEMGRNTQYANHQDKVITDALEPHSYIIIAKTRNTIIGSFRINFPEDGEISYYDDFYTLTNFKSNSIGIGTRYMVHPNFRGNYVSHLLVDHSIDFLRQLGKKSLIIDCNPPVYKLFEKQGFTDYLGEKESKEYGKVRIMRFDL